MCIIYTVYVISTTAHLNHLWLYMVAPSGTNTFIHFPFIPQLNSMLTSTPFSSNNLHKIDLRNFLGTQQMTKDSIRYVFHPVLPSALPHLRFQPKHLQKVNLIYFPPSAALPQLSSFIQPKLFASAVTTFFPGQTNIPNIPLNITNIILNIPNIFLYIKYGKHITEKRKVNLVKWVWTVDGHLTN